ncbi:MAG TPA: hypothetical protein VII58_13845 [Acidobacteriaceae bacterium]
MKAYCAGLCLAAAVLLVRPATRVDASGAPSTPQSPAMVGADAKQIVTTMLTNEDLALRRPNRYTYISEERSDRTGGHLWREKVVETGAGKVRMLLEEDGQPLSPEREAEERGRLAQIVADPAGFARSSQTMKDDEAHALQLLQLLPKAFLFSDVRSEGGDLHIDFRPDPAYVPQSMEQRVLHGMSGTVLIDANTLRVHHIEGRLPQDVSIGFGLLATIRAGSTFATTRAAEESPDWKTAQLDTNINGRAIFFKTIARKEHSEHGKFTRVPNDITATQAVTVAEQP